DGAHHVEVAGGLVVHLDESAARRRLEAQRAVAEAVARAAPPPGVDLVGEQREGERGIDRHDRGDAHELGLGLAPRRAIVPGVRRHDRRLLVRMRPDELRSPAARCALAALPDELRSPAARCALAALPDELRSPAARCALAALACRAWARNEASWSLQNDSTPASHD